MVPLADPVRDIQAYRDEVLAAAARVIDAGPYILGDTVKAFEAAMAQRLGVSGASGVASGTDALALALQALGVGAGDEVVTVSHTAGPTVAAIRMIGARPVFVDIESECYGLAPDCLDVAFGPKTKAVIAVHLYGHPAQIDDIRTIAHSHNIPILEDCAQAQEATLHGRAVGSFGDAAAFSFYPTKILGAIGDGGLVASNRVDVIERVDRLRTYGWTKPQLAEIPFGRCSRLDPLQAAILDVRLQRLDGEVERRRALANGYADAFRDLPIALPIERPGARHVYHLYVVRTDRREALAAHLKDVGVMTGRHYPFPVHRQPGLAEGARIPAPLTVTEKIADEILTLPLFTSMSEDEHRRVIEGVRGFFGKR